ncbi:MAG: ABC1 kinase family protein, partial [Erysipelotrichaceae bacterium]
SLNLEHPVELRLALEELGPTFVKMGQLLATRIDLFPPEAIHEFQKLQDQTEPLPFDALIPILERSYGEKWRSHFGYINPVPLASASLAQVHEATLLDGQTIVLKIQRPKSKETIMADLAILKKLAKWATFTIRSQVIRFDEVIAEIERSILQELDFEKEALHTQRFYELQKSVPFVKVPSVIMEYSKKEILALEKCEGTKLYQIQVLKEQGYDLEELSQKLVTNYCKQVFEDGFFHGDPHPGNILIADKKIVLLDFGLMGELNSMMRKQFLELLVAYVVEDLQKIQDVLLMMAIVHKEVDERALYQDIALMYRQYGQASLADLDLAKMVNEILQISRKHELGLPNGLVVLCKGLLTMESLVSMLVPGKSVLELIIPYAKKIMEQQSKEYFSLENQGKLLFQLYRSTMNLPTQTNKVLQAASAGKLAVRVDAKLPEENIKSINKMINRIVFAIVVAALFVASALIINVAAGPQYQGIAVLGLLGFVVAGFFGLWLLISILRSNNL